MRSDDARVLMSYEHRALGFRPPPGSLAAQVQGAVASAKNDSSKPVEAHGVANGKTDQAKAKQRRSLNQIPGQGEGAKAKRRAMSMGESISAKERQDLQAKAYKRQSSGGQVVDDEQKSREEKLKAAATRDAFRIK